MMTLDIPLALNNVYKKIGQFFSHTYLFKQKYIRSDKKLKYLEKFIS